ncbi:hypothetical protein [Desulfonatronum thioautotrophicum]|uniref:hypothetical protein n=1 Tax=Desulfonatronum thioautotrophicum TaxID=617001 RepID=UPI0005EBDE4A|nr:hypothetical protein [Desulfonatronum thioautotrophicum]
MNTSNDAEIRFVELMTELFQMDEAECLDFGLYRIIRRQNAEVRDFLGEIVQENGQKVLKGGKIGRVLEETFAEVEAEHSMGRTATKEGSSTLDVELS